MSCHNPRAGRVGGRRALASHRPVARERGSETVDCRRTAGPAGGDRWVNSRGSVELDLVAAWVVVSAIGPELEQAPSPDRSRGESHDRP